MREVVEARGAGLLTLDYAALVSSETLEPLATVGSPARAIIAGRVGTTRLIDNRQIVVPDGGSA
jgi:pantothenate synthetase